MTKLILIIGMIASAAVHADDYQLEWTPGGANIRDITPKQSPADAALARAILALQLQLAAQAPAVVQKRIVDIAVYGRCDRYVAYQITYSDGSFETVDVTSGREPINFQKLGEIHAKFPHVHLAGNECLDDR